jgi:hypothetical protein
MDVLSEPPGAAVWVNHRYVGKTPVEGLRFTHYGAYSVVLRREGFRPKEATEELRAPWYERFPADAVSDNLTPWTAHDHRVLSYRLEPVVMRPEDGILAKAAEARERLGKALEKKGLPLRKPPSGGEPPERPTGEPGPGPSAKSGSAPLHGEPPDLPEEAPGPPAPAAK